MDVNSLISYVLIVFGVFLIAFLFVMLYIHFCKKEYCKKYKSAIKKWCILWLVVFVVFIALLFFTWSGLGGVN